MGVLLALTITIFSLSSFAQEKLMTRHQALCEGHANCRLNIIQQKNKVLSGTCKGKMPDVFNCEVKYTTGTTEGSSLNILCVNPEGHSSIDQKVTSESITYKVAAIISGFTGEESLIVDPNEYTFFNNSGLTLFLSRSDKSMTAEMIMNQKDDGVPFTEVTCN